MNKAKAKNLINALIDEGLAPSIREIGANDFSIRVNSDVGLTTAQIQQAETQLVVVAKVYQVDFN